MEKVKEEFMLSLIFVGKWVFLGLGVVGILYVAIYLAYHKSYYDPRMDKYDLEISEIVEHIDGLEETKINLSNGLEATNNNIKELEDRELPKTENEIEKSKEGISRLGLKWWNKISIPMIEKSDTTKQAYQSLENAENKKENVEHNIETLRDKSKSSNKSIANVSLEIKNFEADLSEKKRDKKRAEVDVKGPLLWVISILGLT